MLSSERLLSPRPASACTSIPPPRTCLGALAHPLSCSCSSANCSAPKHLIHYCSVTFQLTLLISLSVVQGAIQCMREGTSVSLSLILRFTQNYLPRESEGLGQLRATAVISQNRLGVQDSCAHTSILSVFAPELSTGSFRAPLGVVKKHLVGSGCGHLPSPWKLSNFIQMCCGCFTASPTAHPLNSVFGMYLRRVYNSSMARASTVRKGRQCNSSHTFLLP
jgi:hypothetical protein